MPTFPAVNLVAVFVAPLVTFAVAGIYWALVAPRLSGLLGGATATERMPASGLAVALATRFVLAYGLAVVIVWAAATSAAGGLVVGLTAAIAFALTIVAGQTAFGRGTWRDYAALVPQLLIEYGLMGAILAAWR
jgi:hypothetical protein